LSLPPMVCEYSGFSEKGKGFAREFGLIKHYKLIELKYIVVSGGSCLKRSSTQVTWDLRRMGQNGWWRTRTSTLLVR
jgi:hypothetical protein